MSCQSEEGVSSLGVSRLFVTYWMPPSALWVLGREQMSFVVGLYPQFASRITIRIPRCAHLLPPPTLVPVPGSSLPLFAPLAQDAEIDAEMED